MTLVRSLIAALAALALSAAPAPAQEMPKPGPEHEKLKQLAGEWAAAVKVTPQPGAAAQESKAEYTAKIDLGGFFLATEFKGDMFGQPFVGRGLTGYDPHKKKYIGTWVDSMGPAIFATEGAFEKDGTVYAETMNGPGPDGKPMTMRGTTTLKDKDTILFTLHAPGPDGKEYLVMDVTYTRKK